MITLAFAQMAYYVFAGIDRYGGDDGLTIHTRSRFFAPLDLSNKVQFYYLCLALLFAAMYLIWRLTNSRFGLVIRGVRSNEARMRAIGFPIYRYKLICFVIAGTLCGLAGALLANHADFVSPSMLYWTRSGDLMIMVILGGMGTPVGPLFGAVALLVLEEMLSRITEHWENSARAPSAAGGAVRARRHRRAPAGGRAEARMTQPLLQIDGLTKRFGGVIACDGVTLGVAAGELHAVIGPNGAGKTTLIGQLTGEIAPDAGRIVFAGRDITDLPVHRRSAIGLARSFQITSLFLDFTALDNVALAVQAHDGHSFRFWRDARNEPELRRPARAALARVGLADRADVVVAAMSHGEHRQLEIAMALATRPAMLLLDEPMAGMGPEESQRMVATLGELKRELTILLIEHDMEAVFALADRITVLVYGRVIATGAPEEIRANPDVRQAYLGEDEGEVGTHA